MLTGSLKTFHRQRQALIGLMLVGPVLLLAGAWWWVNSFLLAPAVPTDRTPADQCVSFICHEKGLPRLRGEESQRFLEWQARRFIRDPEYARRFVAASHSAAPEERQAFREHLFDAFKPLLMSDVRRCERLESAERAAFIDERIVEYNRIVRVLEQSAVGQGARKMNAGAMSDSDKLAMLQMALSRTTEDERERAQRYASVLGARIGQILADAELRAEFERRIAEGTP
jgi:hypothetical protein